VNTNKDFLCLIPARSGSKSVKNKNIKNIYGKPLIYWTIKEAIKSKCFKEVFVSTDSKKIQFLAKKFGAQCPYLRPKNISGDKSSTLDTIKYTLSFLKKKDIKYKYVILLQPTSPLRDYKDIKKSIKLFIKNKNATSLVSLVRVDDNHPSRMYFLKKNYLLKHSLSEKKTGTIRQKLKKMYLRNGAIYIIKYTNINKKNFLGQKSLAYIMPHKRSINIDSGFDFKIADLILRKKL